MSHAAHRGKSRKAASDAEMRNIGAKSANALRAASMPSAMPVRPALPTCRGPNCRLLPGSPVSVPAPARDAKLHQDHMAHLSCRNDSTRLSGAALSPTLAIYQSRTDAPPSPPPETASTS